MCGIFGVINKDTTAVSERLLKDLTAIIGHRGPDGDGYFVHNNLGLGHKRLSIIDKEGGKQPFFSEDNNLALIYNGECYNFPELKDSLEKDGIHFKTRSDTEVVLKLFEQFGEDSFIKLNAMFAVAFYDKQKNQLTLARDRFGVKPIYYWDGPKTFVFSSEIKAIIRHPEYKRQLDYEALNEYFSFQNIFSDRTFFHGIKKLPHASFLSYDLNKNTFSLTQYWDFRFSSLDWNLSQEETTMLLENTFEQAVKRQMISDVPLGSYLSGGIDSGGVTSILATHEKRLSTFTCGFDLSGVSGLELDFDERVRAEIISSHYKTRHYEVVLNANDLEWCIDDVIHALDEPMLGMTYPNFYISELAGKFVKVVFSGAGGDELFGGYPWRYFRATDLGPGEENYIRSYYNYWQRLIQDEEKSSLFTSTVNTHMDSSIPFESFRSVFKNYDGKVETAEDYINKSLYFEVKTFLQGLLVIEDKLNMAHSIEARVPFLDNELVDLALKIPARFKIKNLHNLIRFDENETAKSKKYYLQSSDGKDILRNALKKFLPQEIFNAKKQGFSAPDESWNRGERIKFIQREILADKSPVQDIINKSFIEKKLSEHVEGKANHRLFIWSIISVNSFLKNFFN